MSFAIVEICFAKQYSSGIPYSQVTIQDIIGVFAFLNEVALCIVALIYLIFHIFFYY
ncbi:hypothetical protein XFF6990_380027 [Xanthomonas citri pv. fuscans]|nr:hypothetical protein XFF6990_380027 [Xanthomonas citri pv. fuscans]